MSQINRQKIQALQQLRTAAITLCELSNNKIATPQRDNDKQVLSLEIGATFADPSFVAEVTELALLGCEYGAFIGAMAPVVNRCNLAVYQAQQMQRAQAAEGDTKSPLTPEQPANNVVALTPETVTPS
jgi:hypothetical protein